ncbi:MAG: PorV/PorQ family protein [bacterium]
MKKLFSICMCILLSSALHAGDTVGTSSAVFLKKAVGARAAALGEAYTAMIHDPDAYFFNPASISLQQNPELSAMYQTGIADISFGSLIYAHPLGIWGTPAIGVLYSDAGSIDVNVTGQPRAYKKAQQDTAYTIGYAARFFDMLSIGIGSKFIDSTLVEDFSDSTAAADAGVLFETPLKGLLAGGSILNMGSGLNYKSEADPLPKTYRAGISYIYSLFTEEENLYTFLLAGDFFKTLDEDSKSGVGLELTRNNFALRLGYKIHTDIEGLTAGIGIQIQRYSFDYAFGLVEDLDHNHRLSFHVHFGGLTSNVEFKRKRYQEKKKPVGWKKKDASDSAPSKKTRTQTLGGN